MPKKIDKKAILTIIITTMFEIIYAPAVKGHLKAVDRKYHKLIRQAIETQLRLEPDVETQNRKPLKRPIALDAE